MLFSFSLTDPCTAGGKKPYIFVPADTFEFEPVPAGVPVSHAFIIQNKGDAALKIEKIASDCGCTTVAYSKQIAPNGEGEAVIRLNTIDYGGNRVKKYVELFCNDPQNPELTLTITGSVEKVVDIHPMHARLFGPAGTDIKTHISITPEEKYTFRILTMQTQTGEHIKLKLNQTSQTGRPVYTLTIENVKKTPGRYYDLIYLNTDSRVRPQLKIPVFGNIGKN